MGNLLGIPDMVIYVSRYLTMVDLVLLREVSKEMKRLLDGKPLLWKLAAMRNFEMGIKWAAVYNQPDVVCEIVRTILSTPEAKKEGLKLALPLLDTGIQWAAEMGHFNLVEYFLSQGAQKTLGLNGAVKGWLGEKAPSESYMEIIDFIIKKHPRFDIISLVAVNAHCTPHNRAILQYLLEKGANPNAALEGREHKDSELHYTTVKLLLENKANPNEGLLRVSLLTDSEVVNLLLENGADPEKLVHSWSVSKDQEHVKLLQKAIDLKKKREKESLLTGCCIF